MVSLARGLAARGHNVVLLADASSAAHAQATAAPPETLQITAFPARGRRGGSARVRALRSAIRAHESDVVIVHSEADHFVAALALVGLRRKPVLVRRIAVGERTRLTRTGRVAERLAPAVHLLTGRAGVDVPGQPNETIRLRSEIAVALPAHEPAQLAATEPVLVCVYDAAATIHASRVLRAVTMLRKRHRQLTLHMIAADQVPERLRMQAAALGLSRVVRWVRAPSGVDDIIAQAWALIVAIGGDDAVFATLDGMAHGVPVVAPRAALFERYVANGISGILLETFDAPACAAALATLISDDDRRAAMGGAARSRVARDYAEQEANAALDDQLQALVMPNAESQAGVA
jgi:hypothetical protein